MWRCVMVGAALWLCACGETTAPGDGDRSGGTGAADDNPDVVPTGGTRGGGGLDGTAAGIEPDDFGGGGGTEGTGGTLPPDGTGGGFPPGDDVCDGAAVDLQHSSEHCGSCGNGCAPSLLATGPSWPLWLALDQTHAYWITGGNEGEVLSVPLAGGAPTTLASGQGHPQAFAIDEAHAYWVAGSKLRRVPLTGGEVTDLVDGFVYAKSMVAASDGLYFVSYDQNSVAAAQRVPLEGGTPEVLVADIGGRPLRLSLDGTNMYWLNALAAEQDKVLRAPRTGGATATALATGGYTSFGADIDGSHFYWLAFDGFAGSRLLRVPLAGGEPEQLATSGSQGRSVAVTRHHVYWTNDSTGSVYGGPVRNDGTVMRIPIGGGSPTTLASQESDPESIVSNGHTVCWVEYLGPSVKCLSPCVMGACQ